MNEDILIAELTMNGKPISSVDKVAELQSLMNEELDERIIKTRKGTAEIYLKQDAICLTSQGDKGIIINQNGTTIDGKLHIAQEPSKIRINGFWTLNDELMTTLPSTIYTPIPTLVYNEPAAVENIQGYVKFLKGLG